MGSCQALFFQLRTTKEDMTFIKKQAMARAMTAGTLNSSTNAPAMIDPTRRPDSDQLMRDVTGEADIVKKENFAGEAAGPPQGLFAGSQPNSDSHGSEPQQRTGPPATHASSDTVTSYPMRQPWEYIEEVVQILKTASPLLILSMETMVDQISHRFKATPEEEIYRLICMLLQDAIQVSTDDTRYYVSSASFSFRIMWCA